MFICLCVCVCVYHVCLFRFLCLCDVCGGRGSNVAEPKANLKPGKVEEVAADADGSQKSADSLAGDKHCQRHNRLSVSV